MDTYDTPSHVKQTSPFEAWWRGAVIYQVYPRSFKDSNNDGVGDLPGITSKLDYIASLGVDAIWLSPFFPSPQVDFGYDVSNYTDVDPQFGTMADFDSLVKKSHSLGLKVIIDQIYSHTSDQHPWFTESRQGQHNAKSDWYVWADAKPDGSPPSNWQSVFGGPAWEWDSRRKQYYLHNFLKEQPDLNLHNDEVREAILEVARFWLRHGADGFRLDALNFAMHDPSLRDNPPANIEMEFVTRPFDMQLHMFSRSYRDIPLFLEELRNELNQYPDRFTVAEVVGADAIEEMRSFTHGDARLNAAYNFDFLYAEQISSERVRNSLEQWDSEASQGWPAWAFSNHDAPRAVSRWATEEERSKAARVYLMLLLALKGTLFLYQGEELGLPQANVPFEKLKDPEAIANWPLTLGRDGARTPMPWVNVGRNAGFSDEGTETWMPVDDAQIKLCVEEQDQDPNSNLAFSRMALKLRKEHEPLLHGRLFFADAPDGVLMMRRESEGESCVCIFNLSSQTADWPDGIGAALPILSSLQVGAPETELPEKLPPLSAWWLSTVV